MSFILEEEVTVPFQFEYDALAEKVINACLDYAKFPYEAEVNLTLTDNEGIHVINKEFRQIDRPTDVLSFPIYTKEEIDDLKNKNVEEDISLGDLILCMDVIEEHSIEYNTGLDREMLYMITHGVCHLLGFDHEIAEEKAVMRMREEEILKNI